MCWKNFNKCCKIFSEKSHNSQLYTLKLFHQVIPWFCLMTKYHSHWFKINMLFFICKKKYFTQIIPKDDYFDDHEKIPSTHVRFPWVPMGRGSAIPKTRGKYPCKTHTQTRVEGLTSQNRPGRGYPQRLLYADSYIHLEANFTFFT